MNTVQTYRRSLTSQDMTINPFPIAIVDNFINQSIFDKAKTHWRSLNFLEIKWENYVNTLDHQGMQYKIYGGGRDRSSQSKMHELFYKSEEWQRIFKVFESQQLADEIYQALKNLGYPVRRFKVRSPNYKQGILSAILYNNVYVNYKLSRYPTGSSISLHRDLHDKVVAFLLYLGFSDSVSRPQGGTQFYRRKFNAELSEFEVDHHIYNVDDFELLHDVEPKENRLAFFVRTNNSWHGVKKFDSADLKGVTRDNLQINYMKCQQAAFLKIIGQIATKGRACFEFFAAYFVTFKLVYLEARFFQPSKKVNNSDELKWSLKRRLTQLIFPTDIYNVILQYYLFLRGTNFLLDKRRRLIRRTVLKYALPPRQGLTLAANYAIDSKSLIGVFTALCFGIYKDLRFETELAETYGLNVLAADPTPIAVQTWQKQKPNPKLKFAPFALSTEPGIKKFYFDSDDSSPDTFEGSLQNIRNTSRFLEVSCDTLEGFKKKHGIRYGEKYLLKMDIEGGAVEILEDLLMEGVKKENLPVQIAVEFELPHKGYDVLNFRIAGLLSSLRKYYEIFYIPRMRRYGNYEFLFVLKSEPTLCS